MSSDYHLRNFAWSKYKSHYVVLPETFLQALRPYITTSFESDKNFIDIFFQKSIRRADIELANIKSEVSKIFANHNKFEPKLRFEILSNQTLMEKLVADTRNLLDDEEKTGVLVQGINDELHRIEDTKQWESDFEYYLLETKNKIKNEVRRNWIKHKDYVISLYRKPRHLIELPIKCVLYATRERNLIGKAYEDELVNSVNKNELNSLVMFTIHRRKYFFNFCITEYRKLSRKKIISKYEFLQKKQQEKQGY